MDLIYINIKKNSSIFTNIMMFSLCIVFGIGKIGVWCHVTFNKIPTSGAGFARCKKKRYSLRVFMTLLWW